jgi:5-methylcytosine-specific restriction endonuclease McrA
MRSWNPEKVLKSHVRKAAQIWRKNGGFLNFKNSTKYDVFIDGKPYPPKAISSIAHQLATEQILRADDFGGSKEGIWHRRLKVLGFQIQEKGLGSAFSDKVSKSLKLSRSVRLKKIAEAAKQPPAKFQAQVTRYARSPHVVAERLVIANGRCEKCQKPAPFTRLRDNTPYLEVHHVKLLSQGGLDSVENTQALCPNCHSEVHDRLRVESDVE